MIQAIKNRCKVKLLSIRQIIAIKLLQLILNHIITNIKVNIIFDKNNIDDTKNVSNEEIIRKIKEANEKLNNKKEKKEMKFSVQNTNTNDSRFAQVKFTDKIDTKNINTNPDSFKSVGSDKKKENFGERFKGTKIY